MIVNRTEDQEGPAKMTLYFREAGATLRSDIPQPSSSTEGFAKAPAPVEGERAVTIEMKGRRSEAILKEFMDKTGAMEVQPTPQDEMQLQEAEELEARSKIDRERVRALIEGRKREKAMLAAAHAESAALKAEA
jgi:large subunit ribosomal protein MRP49